MTVPKEDSVYKYRTPEGEIKTMTVLGHNVLVRKCVLPESAILFSEPTEPADPFANTMVNSLTSNLSNNQCEVLAIGQKVGQRRSKGKIKSYGLRSSPQCIPNQCVPVRKRSIVILPEMGNTVQRGATGMDYDFMVDESELIAIVRE